MAFSTENNVKVIRLDRGLTLTDLARLSNVHIADIQKVEAGLRVAYPGWRKRISAALAMPEEQLFPTEAEQP